MYLKAVPTRKETFEHQSATVLLVDVGYYIYINRQCGQWGKCARFFKLAIKIGQVRADRSLRIADAS